MSLLVLYFFLAVGISFLCSVLEAVLLSTTPYYIDSLMLQKKAGALLLKKNRVQIDKSISGILTLNTFANTLGAAGVGAQAMVLFGKEYMFFTSAILTLIILYFSEIIPKTIGALYWKNLAIPAAYIIRGIIYITYPLLLISGLVTRLFKKGQRQKMSRDEIKAVSEQGEKEGILDEQESGIIENLLNLKTHKVKDILTPRSVMFALEKSMTVKEFFENEDYDTFSRIPIFDKTLDNIEGVVLLRHLLIEKMVGNNDKKLHEIAVPIFHIYKNISVSKALELFIKRKEHIFIVQDNYSQTEGIVTLEDAIETLLGVEITDEFDNVEDMQALAKLRLRQKNRL